MRSVAKLSEADARKPWVTAPKAAQGLEAVTGVVVEYQVPDVRQGKARMFVTGIVGTHRRRFRPELAPAADRARRLLDLEGEPAVDEAPPRPGTLTTVLARPAPLVALTLIPGVGYPDAAMAVEATFADGTQLQAPPPEHFQRYDIPCGVGADGTPRRCPLPALDRSRAVAVRAAAPSLDPQLAGLAAGARAWVTRVMTPAGGGSLSRVALECESEAPGLLLGAAYRAALGEGTAPLLPAAVACAFYPRPAWWDASPFKLWADLGPAAFGLTSLPCDAIMKRFCEMPAGVKMAQSALLAKTFGADALLLPVGVCACVTTPSARGACLDRRCAENSKAYRLAGQTPFSDEPAPQRRDCRAAGGPLLPSCEDVKALGGNLTPGFPPPDCGETPAPTASSFTSNQVLLFLLLVLVAVVLLSGRRKKPPPEALGLPSLDSLS